MSSVSPPLSAPAAATVADRHAAAILRSVVDHGVVGFDPHGVVMSWNEGAARITGWTAAEAIGRLVSLLFTPEDEAAGATPAGMLAVLDQGAADAGRWHVRRDGARFWADGALLPLHAADGAVEGYVKFLHDRTERRAAGVALARSEERLRTLYDQIDEGFCLIEVACDDAARPIDYRFLEVNAAFERQTGLVDAAGSWMRDLAPDHEEHWFETYAKVALSGEAIRFTLPAEALDSRWYEVFAYRIGDPADRRVAILFSDITDRRRRETRRQASEEHLRSLNETLRGSQANLRLLLNTINEGFYAVDRDGVTTTCNAAFLRMMGFAGEAEAIGRKLHDVIHHSHPDGTPYATADCPIYAAASTGVSAHVREEQFFPLAGPPLWVEYWATPVYRDGQLQGAICTFLNIAERKAAEDEQAATEARRLALLRLNDRLRNMTDPAAMALAPAEVIGEVIGVDVAGYGTIDAAGTRLCIDLAWAAPGMDSIAGDHDMRAYGIYIDDLVRGSAVVIADVAQDARTADHATSFAAIGVRALVNVPLVEMGRLSAIFCAASERPRAWTADEVEFIRDVAERTRAAIERRRAERALRDLADSLQQQIADRTQERDQIWRASRDMLGVADGDGRWLSVNPAWTEVLGWPGEAFIGRTSQWLEHPDDQTRTRAEVDQVAGGRPAVAFENRFRTKAGDYRDLSWTAVSVDGRLYCVSRDVTEQKLREAALLKAEEQLRQSQKVEAVGQLTGGVAHDFNNLLTVIRGSVDLLRRDDVPEARRKRYIDAIADTADRATRLTSQLLAFARRQALRPEVFDVTRSLEAIREMVGTLVGSRVVVTTSAPELPCLINADRSQFDTAIVNMAVNGRDAMDGEGELVIAIGRSQGMPPLRSHPAAPGDFVTVAIRDTGSGIAPDRIDRIFEPFFTTKGVGHGTGLGLSQVFGFAKQSGGDILVESVEGEGSVFTLYLPWGTQVTDAPDEPEIVGQALGAGARILVVEDNEEVGTFAIQALTELGHDPVRAVDARSALETLRSGGARFDVVFSDVVMPGMSGVELAREIGRFDPTMPVVLTSGYSSILADDGAHGFDLLHKPYSIDELSRALNKVKRPG